jgi:hypothetical protein
MLNRFFGPIKPDRFAQMMVQYLQAAGYLGSVRRRQRVRVPAVLCAASDLLSAQARVCIIVELAMASEFHFIGARAQ